MGIEEVSIPSKSKSLLIYINPLQSIWIENNRKWTCSVTPIQKGIRGGLNPIQVIFY
jgi:hypothetical protein